MLKSTLIGIALGIVALIIIELVFGLTFVGKVKDDYQDDVESVVNILAAADEAVIQPDQIISGLLSSEDFQEFIEKGIAKGWWTADFIIQFTFDDVLPVRAKEFKFIINTVKESETGQKLTELIPQLKDLIVKIKPIIQKIIQSLNSEQLANLIAKLAALKAKILSLDLSQLQALVNKLANILEQLQALIPKIKTGIAELNKLVVKVQVLIKKLNQITNSSTVQTIKKLIQAYKNGTLDDIIKDKIINSDIGQKLNNLINNLNTLTWDDVKQFILQAVADSSLGEKIKEIIDKVNSTVDDVQALIDKLLTNVEEDFDFNTVANENGKVVLPDGTQISARLLNALDLEITYTYDNKGTKLNIKDDTLVINQIAIGLEAIGNKIYLGSGVLSDKIITGKNCITLNTMIPIVNSTI